MTRLLLLLGLLWHLVVPSAIATSRSEAPALRANRGGAAVLVAAHAARTTAREVARAWRGDRVADVASSSRGPSIAPPASIRLPAPEACASRDVELERIVPSARGPPSRA